MANKLSSFQISEIGRRHEAGESLASLSKEYGACHGTTRARLAQIGVKIRTQKEAGKLTRKLSTSQAAEIASLYLSGSPATQIAERFNIPIATIYNCLAVQGIARRANAESKRKHTLNESVFDILNEESAYWIGFLMADGCVHYPKQKASPRISIVLAKRDVAHLERFRNFIGSSHKITFVAGAVSLAVSSTNLANSLERYGVTARKSFTARAIKLERNKHFWRGVIDGDGCISAEGQKRRLSLIGSLALMQQFASFVETNTGGYKPRVQRYVNIFEVRLNGMNAVKMLDIIYSKCTIALPRKLERARSVTEREEIDFKELSKRVKVKRNKEGLSYSKLRGKTGISVGMLWRIENGRDIPYGVTRSRLASWIEIPTKPAKKLFIVEPKTEASYQDPSRRIV